MKLIEHVLWVQGVPAPQGSKTAYGGTRANGTRYTNVVESGKKKLEPWRAAVTAVAAGRGGAPPKTDVHVEMVFYLPRPRGHYGTGRNAGRLKPSAPTYCATKPDVDKLLRAVFDGLTDSGLLHDDAQVVSCYAVKKYAELGGGPGASVTVRWDE